MSEKTAGEKWLEQCIGKSVDEVLSEENRANAAADLALRIGNKCGWGEQEEVLTHPERVIHIVWDMIGEVNNGGFCQYFSNSAGSGANELVQACRELGAPITAEICAKALSVFGGPVPTDWEERNDLLDEVMSEEAEALLEECDDAFYEEEEDLSALIRAYALQHRDSIS